jgi:hypothetical protein
LSAGKNRHEERRNFGSFFRKNKNESKKTARRKKPIQAHTGTENAERENEKKRLVEADGEEEEVHYILYQKHIFKVNSQPKKIIFECEPLLLVLALLSVSPQSN